MNPAWIPAMVQGLRWAAVTAVSYFGYETVKEVSTAVTAPPPPVQMEPNPIGEGLTAPQVTAPQAKFVRVAVMAALGLATLAVVDRLRSRRR
jgi:hypothetical protein